MAQGEDTFAQTGELVTAGSGRQRRLGGPGTGTGGSGGRRVRGSREAATPPGTDTGAGAGPGPDGGAGSVAGGGAVPVPPPLPPPRSLETASVAEVLGGYLHARSGDFLRSLRLHAENAGSAETAAGTADAVRRLRRSARRLNGALHTYRPLLDAAWADQLRTELSWLSGTLAREYAYAARLDRLLGALHRLASDGGSGGGTLPVGAARAGALLERQLTLARTRAHSAALQALGSSRFHAVADAVAVLASDAPLLPETAGGQAAPLLVPLAEQAQRRLTEAVDALPLSRAEAPYNAEALARSLGSEVQHDAAWHQVRLLLRLHRYAEEVLLWGAAGAVGAAEPAPDIPGPATAQPAAPAGGPDPRLGPASAALDRHRDAAEAAAAAAAAARTPRIAPATAYALGVLHADQRHEVEAARFAFGRLWNPRRPERGGAQ